MVGVTITADLVTPVVMPPVQWPLMLDAVLAWRLMRAKRRMEFGQDRMTGDSVAETDQLPLPFDRREQNGLWWWDVSCAVTINDGGAGVEWQHSRNDHAKYDRRVPIDSQEKITETQARWKVNRLPRIATAASGLRWIANTPDPDRLLACCEHVKALGKNWSRGSGQVKGWRVECSDAPVELTSQHRPLPGEGAEHRIRPPYWWREGRVSCS